MRGHGPLSEPEWAQLEAELAADRRYRRRAWAVLPCGLAAFWAVVAALVAILIKWGEVT
jgi:hypothetical protein